MQIEYIKQKRKKENENAWKLDEDGGGNRESKLLGQINQCSFFSFNKKNVGESKCLIIL